MTVLAAGASLEGGGIGDAGHERAGEQRADARDLHQAATYPVFRALARMRRSFSRICTSQQPAVRKPQADTRIGRNAQILAISDTDRRSKPLRPTGLLLSHSILLLLNN
jgi:hypothetical protein